MPDTTSTQPVHQYRTRPTTLPGGRPKGIDEGENEQGIRRIARQDLLHSNPPPDLSSDNILLHSRAGLEIIEAKHEAAEEARAMKADKVMMDLAKTFEDWTLSSGRIQEVQAAADDSQDDELPTPSEGDVATNQLSVDDLSLPDTAPHPGQETQQAEDQELQTLQRRLHAKNEFTRIYGLTINLAWKVGHADQANVIENGFQPLLWKSILDTEEIVWETNGKMLANFRNTYVGDIQAAMQRQEKLEAADALQVAAAAVPLPTERVGHEELVALFREFQGMERVQLAPDTKWTTSADLEALMNSIKAKFADFLATRNIEVRPNSDEDDAGVH